MADVFRVLVMRCDFLKILFIIINLQSREEHYGY